MLRFGAGIDPGAVSVVRSGNDLVLSIGSANDKVTIQYYFSSNSYAVDEIRFADGTTWDVQRVKELAVTYGDAMDNSITGYNGAGNRIYGLDGRDNISGGDAGDLIDGGNGDDTLSGYGGNDTLIGGPGNDKLYGGLGDDTYYVDSAADTVTEYAAQGNDTIVASVSIDLTALPNIENVTLTGSNALNATGNAAANVLIGNNEGNILAGAAGSDLLVGGLGNDAYVFGPGFGLDTIRENDPSVNQDKIVFSAGIAPNQVSVARDGMDLLLSVDAANKVRVEGWYIDDAHKIESVEFSDGTAWTVSDLRSKTNAAPQVTSAIAAQSAMEGVPFQFVVPSNAFSDADASIGDALHYSASLADGTPLPAWLNFDSSSQSFYGVPGAGDIVPLNIRVTATDSVGASTSSVFDLAVDTAYVRGTAASDTLTDARTAMIFVGGQGNDTIVASGDNATIVYNLGDGTDHVTTGGGGDVLQLGQGISASDLTVGLGSLKIQVGSNPNDVIHFETFDPQNVEGSRPFDRIAFADGSTLSYTDLVARGFDLVGTSGDDVITGTDVNDRMAGGAGNDTYHFAARFGSDTISENDATPGNADRIVFDAGIDPAQVAVSRDGIDLLLSESATDEIRVAGWFTDDAHKIETVEFANGTVWTVDDLRNRADIAPHLGSAIPDQATNQGDSYAFTIPSDAFADADSVVGDALNYSATLSTGDPLPNWLSFDASTRTFSGVPSNGDVGDLAVKVVVTDMAGVSASQVFSVAVANVNDAPTVSTMIADQVATQDAAFNFVIPADIFTDIDIGDTLSYSATLANGDPLPTWLRFDVDTRTFSGTPTNADVGNLAIRVTATDLAGAAANQGFELVVANVNDAPIALAAIADQFAVQDVAFAFAVPAGSFADIDLGDSLSYGATLANGEPLPTWLTFDRETQTFSGTPTNGDVGNLSVALTATDVSGTSASQTFVLAVANVNDAPLVAPDTASAGEDGITAATGNVLANDQDIDVGTTLAVGNPGTFQGIYGTLTLGADGEYAYALANDSTAVQSLGAGQIVNDTFSYIANDGQAEASSSLAVQIVGMNDAPLIGTALSNQTGQSGIAFSYALPASAFTDIDTADKLSYSATLSDGSVLPAWLTIDPTTGLLSGTPTGGAGTYQIDVIATDQGGASAKQGFSLDVQQSGNSAPVAETDSASVTEDSVLFTTGNVLDNDRDADGDVLTLSNPGLLKGAYGSIFLKTDGTYAYLLDNGSSAVQALGIDQSVLDRFTYQATDGKDSTAGDLVIAIDGKNDAPVLLHHLENRSFKRNSNIAWQIPVNSFVDIDKGDALAYSAKLSNGATLPSWLKFDAATRTFSGKVPANAKGSIEIEVAASDGHGNQSIATDRFRVSFDEGKGAGDNGNAGAPPSGHGDHSDNGYGFGDDHLNHDHDHEAPKPQPDKDAWDFEKGEHLVCVDLRKLDQHYANFDDGGRENDSSSYMARWIEYDMAVSQWIAEQDKSLPELDGRHGADVGILNEFSGGFLGSRLAFGVDAVSLAAGAGTQIKSFKGLQEGIQRLE